MKHYKIIETDNNILLTDIIFSRSNINFIASKLIYHKGVLDYIESSNLNKLLLFHFYEYDKSRNNISANFLFTLQNILNKKIKNDPNICILYSYKYVNSKYECKLHCSPYYSKEFLKENLNYRLYPMIEIIMNYANQKNRIIPFHI